MGSLWNCRKPFSPHSQLQLRIQDYFVHNSLYFIWKIGWFSIWPLVEYVWRSKYLGRNNSWNNRLSIYVTISCPFAIHNYLPSKLCHGCFGLPNYNGRLLTQHAFWTAEGWQPQKKVQRKWKIKIERNCLNVFHLHWHINTWATTG